MHNTLFISCIPVHVETPRFTVVPDSEYEVPFGGVINLTCEATGSPMPNVKWRHASKDMELNMTNIIGKNVLQLKNILRTENYTCVVTSRLGTIETSTVVRVLG